MATVKNFITKNEWLIIQEIYTIIEKTFTPTAGVLLDWCDLKPELTSRAVDSCLKNSLITITDDLSYRVTDKGYQAACDYNDHWTFRLTCLEQRKIIEDAVALANKNVSCLRSCYNINSYMGKELEALANLNSEFLATNPIEQNKYLRSKGQL